LYKNCKPFFLCKPCANHVEIGYFPLLSKFKMKECKID
jgi:hypothetical protein